MDYTEPEILNLENEECENSKIIYIYIYPQVFKVLACAKQIIFYFKPRASKIFLAGFTTVTVGWFASRMGIN